MNYLVVSFLFLYFSISLDISAADKCIDVNCEGSHCNENLAECVNGECSTDGRCKCNPCFTGAGCAVYVDKYPPSFLRKEETIYLELGQSGIIYDAGSMVRDEDNDWTCISGKPCLCTQKSFEIMTNGNGSHYFSITQTGEVKLTGNAILNVNDHYKLDIATSNYLEDFPYSQDLISIDVLTLHIRIRETLYDDFENEDQDITKEKMKYSKAVNEESEINIQDSNIRVAALNRHKRGTSGTTKPDTMVTLTVAGAGGLAAVPDPLSPGDTILFRLEIVIPTIDCGDKMDLKVEIFVMDATTGISIFALCNVEIADFGSAIVDENGNSGILPADATAHYVFNEVNPSFPKTNQRATLDFGTLCNAALEDTDPTPDYTDSTIAIEFKAILIDNPLFTAAQAVVTAGVEFDLDNNVYIAQGLSDFLPASSVTDAYPVSCTLTGPERAAIRSGATYDIECFITITLADVDIEILTPREQTHDIFSVEDLRVVSRGDAHQCVIYSETKKKYFSVTDRTCHKIWMQIPLLTGNIDHTDLPGEATQAENQINFSFTTYFFGGAVGDVVSIGAGVKIGDNIIWSCIVEVTLEAEDTSAASTTLPGSAMSLFAKDTSESPPQVWSFQGATWEHRIDLGAPAADYTVTRYEIDCLATVSDSAAAKIAGVLMGKSGAYIGWLPNMLEVVTYDATAGSAAWNFVMNTSSTCSPQVRRAENYVSFEVTISYGDLAGTVPTGTLTCNTQTSGANAMVVVKAASAPISDMSGFATVLSGDNNIYPAAPFGVSATIIISGDNVGYEKMVLETSGDFTITAWGAKVCHVDVVSVGLGVGCFAKSAKQSFIDDNIEFMKATDTSLHDDGSKMDFGNMCGAKRDDPTSDEDLEVKLRVFYETPKEQTTMVAADAYSLSLGLLLDDNLIWTAWEDFVAATAVPTTEVSKIIVAAPTTVDLWVPLVTKVIIKMNPGAIRTHKITATSAVPATLHICKIIILNVGRNYACIDKDPKPNEEDITTKSVILTYVVPDYSSGTLDLGVIRNFGSGDIHDSNFGDEDSIEIAIMTRGIVEAASGVALNILYNDADVTGSPFTIIIGPEGVKSGIGTDLVITPPVAPSEYYPDVLVETDVVIKVQANPTFYEQVFVKVIITQAQLDSKQISICYAAVISAGKNLPCLVPALLIGDKTDPLEYSFDLTHLCWYHLSDDPADDEFVLRVGASVFPDASGNTMASTSFDVRADIDVTLGTPVTVTLNKAAGDFELGNITIEDVQLTMEQDEAVTLVEPGQTYFLGLFIKIPAYTTVDAQIGVMASSAEGHAHATVHGFREGDTIGKNIQCIREMEMYEYELLQNSSIDGTPMIHESQTDSMILYLKYLTNTGISNLHGTFEEGDDLAHIQFEILIADHYQLAHGATFTVSFAIKIGTTIIVIEKTLTMDRNTNTVPDAMVLESEFVFNDGYDGTTGIPSGDKFSVTFKLYHVRGNSTIEAYNAIVRLMHPAYVGHANATQIDPALLAGIVEDSVSCNISDVTVTAKEYLDIDISFLFFTDVLECTVTMTVDPYGEMIKGLGELLSSILLKFICKESTAAATAKYCMPTKYLNYKVIGTECYDALDINTFESCQFVASTAIDATNDAHMSSTSTGWFPAVRDVTVWQPYIQIDFKKVARVTRIMFNSISGLRTILLFRLQTSPDGKYNYQDVCDQDITASVAPTPTTLPSGCAINYQRYIRLVIKAASPADETIKIGVHFEWFGCYADPLPSTAVCGFTETTVLTDDPTRYRHAAYDPVNLIFYFCDYNPTKKKMVCYSTADGTTWQILPSYIGSLKGFDATTGRFYANDVGMVTTVSSVNGVDWALVDTTTAAAITPVAPSVIKGSDKATLDASPVSLGSYSIDFDGIKKDGVEIVQWGSCCS